MKDLIEALNIFLFYGDKGHSPTHCEHDTLWVVGYTEAEISEADTKRLDELGFFWSESEDSWISFRFGSA